MKTLRFYKELGKNNHKLPIYNSALNQFGINAQQWMLVEETGELLNAMAKCIRGRSTKADIITELADVHIMVEQMALFYGWDEFMKEKKLKLDRLEQRIKNSI